MELQKTSHNTAAIKITAQENGDTIGWGYLYLIRNDQHDEPYGLMEDVFVQPQFRSRGVGSKIIQAIVEEAQKQNCYKLIGNSRMENTRAHSLYERFGFKKYGYEFRMTLQEFQSK